MERTSKRIISVILSLMLVLNIFNWQALTLAVEPASPGENNVAEVRIENQTTSYSTFSEAWSAATQSNTAATIKLLSNIKENPDSSYTISNGGNITLDLNGHTLTGNGQTSVIKVCGQFTLCDNSDQKNGAEKNGAITGGGGEKGGGVYADNNGKFTMQSGEIRNNKAFGGGGVFIENATFEMSGGQIKDNRVDYTYGIYRYNEPFGGGVFLGEDAKFTMSGGAIASNFAYNGWGGGVHVRGKFTMRGTSKIEKNQADKIGGGVVISENCQGEFLMEGGSITENGSAYSGGVAVQNGRKFKMTGGQITKNFAFQHGGGGVGVFSNASFCVDYKVIIRENWCVEPIFNNIFLRLGQKVIVGENLSDDSEIGLAIESTNMSGTGVFAENVPSGVSKDVFKCDNEWLDIFYNEETKALELR